QARRRRPVAARDPAPRQDAGRDGRGRGPAEPVEHPPRPPRAPLARTGWFVRTAVETSPASGSTPAGDDNAGGEGLHGNEVGHALPMFLVAPADCSPAFVLIYAGSGMSIDALLFDFHDTLVHLPRPVSDEQWHLHGARRLEPLLRAWGAAVDGGVLAADILVRVRRANTAAATTHASPDVAAVVREAARGAGLHLAEDQVQALWGAWY